ncbi:MAG: alpha/beta hydrolase [Lachnospiraceae bacterium]|nr:alpha/beta hydrolase [Lachnospiraceae bacterium]
METKYMTLNQERNVSLTAYLQKTGSEFTNISARPAVLILPGGGYQICSEREMDPAAMAYLKAGYQAFILRYSLGEHAVWPNPLKDYEQAMRMIREHAEEWGICRDKIAVIGFSAGGHLAACAASMSENRPDAAILGYPVITEESAHVWERTAPDAAKAVDRNTCPCFVFATRTDSTVPVKNSLRFIQALEEHNISFESHIYAYGPHGFSTADASVLDPQMPVCGRVHRWVADSIGWLKEMLGDFGPDGITKPLCKRWANGNSADYLSVDCTIGYLMQNRQARPLLGGMMGSAGKQEASGMGSSMSQEGMEVMMQSMTLREALQYGQVPAETIELLQGKLARIENRQNGLLR